MRQTIRLFLLLEGASFIVAGLVHFGVLVHGYEHQEAAIAESSIGVVLLVGLGLTCVWPARMRLSSLATQAFALLGTLVGAFTIAIGAGPRTVPDIAYHLAIVVALVWGLVVAARAPTDGVRAYLGLLDNSGCPTQSPLLSPSASFAPLALPHAVSAEAAGTAPTPERWQALIGRRWPSWPARRSGRRALHGFWPRCRRWPTEDTRTRRAPSSGARGGP